MAGNVRPVIFSALGAGRCLWRPSPHRTWPCRFVANAANRPPSPSPSPSPSPHQTRHYSISTPSAVSETSPSQAEDDLVESAIQLSLAPLNTNAKLRCTQCSSSSAGITTTTVLLSKTELAAAYHLSARDLHVVDLPSPGLPHILVRASTVLVHVFDLRLLIRADRVLQLHVPGLADTTLSRVFAHDLPRKLLPGPSITTTTTTAAAAATAPFELRALEAALAAVAAGLEASYRLARADAHSALRALDAQMSPAAASDASAHASLGALLAVARRLAGLEQRAPLARGALEELLREDRDMADLYLAERAAGRRRAAEDHDEAECLLETYVRASDAVVQETAALMAEAHRTADAVRTALATRRNQIMVLETKVEMAMLGVAAATLVAGWYGMNTVNFLEESGYAFAVIAAGSLLGGGVIWMLLLRKLRNIRRKHR